MTEARPQSIHIPPECEPVVRALWDYLDGRLSPDDAAGIEAHMSLCMGCASHADFQRNLLGALRALRRDPDDLAGLRSRVRTALEEAVPGEA